MYALERKRTMSKAEDLTKLFMATLAHLASLYLQCPKEMRQGVENAIRAISNPLSKEENTDIRAENIIKKLKTSVALLDGGHEIDYSLVFNEDIKVVH